MGEFERDQLRQLPCEPGEPLFFELVEPLTAERQLLADFVLLAMRIQEQKDHEDRQNDSCLIFPLDKSTEDDFRGQQSNH